MPYSKRPGNRGRHPRGCMCAGCTNRRLGKPTGHAEFLHRKEMGRRHPEDCECDECKLVRSLLDQVDESSDEDTPGEVTPDEK